MKKLSGILITTFLASVLLATMACTQVANNANSESAKHASNKIAKEIFEKSFQADFFVKTF